MEVKVIKSIRLKNIPVESGTVLKVRALSDRILDFNPRYQIIEGLLSGEFIPKECIIRVEEEKKFTEKQWNDMENHYMKQLEDEKAKSERLESIISGLTEGLNQDKEEINRLGFYLEATSTAVLRLAETILDLKESSIKQNG